MKWLKQSRLAVVLLQCHSTKAAPHTVPSVSPNGLKVATVTAIPEDLDEHITCGVKKQSRQAKELINSRFIVIDEISMMDRRAIEAVDLTLQDLCKKQLAERKLPANTPFGGKVVVFSGDFRQVLPVVPKATPMMVIGQSMKNSQLWKNGNVSYKF